jgi:hypothetical protein
MPVRFGETPETWAAVKEDTASISDPTAANYAHGEAAYTEVDQNITDQGGANMRAKYLLAKLSAGSERVEPEIPLNPAVFRGHVFRVHSDGPGTVVDHHVYRVEYVEHRVPTQMLTQCETGLGGLYLRTQVPA